MPDYILSIALIICSYLLGSISSAVIITKLVKNKDIREIGDRKAGGSNVIKNVGLLWGLLVGAFDILKGVPFLVLAKHLNLAEDILPFIALAAIAGHNWPIFFSFSGGRGIATILGTMIYLSPSIAILPTIIFASSLIPAIFERRFKISLGFVSSPTLTLLALIVYIFLSINTVETFDDTYSILIFLLVLFRRVTARISEYKDKKNTTYKLFLSRLIYDNSYSIK